MAEPVLRRGLIYLSGLVTVGTAIELALERHWTQLAQLIPWVAIAALLAAVVLLLRKWSQGGVRLVRVLAVAVLLTGLIGVWQHISANHDAGPLDVNYATSWEQLGSLQQWLLAVTKTVGPSPPLAPLALAQAALGLLLATWPARPAAVVAS